MRKEEFLKGAEKLAGI